MAQKPLKLNLDELPDKEDSKIDLETLPDLTDLPDQSEPGNIDLVKQPRVKNADGSISTVRSLSFNEDGREILIPTVVGDKVVSDEEAIDAYHKTGRHLGKFSSIEEANKFADQLHKDYEAGKYEPQIEEPSFWDQITSPLVRPGQGITEATDVFAEKHPVVGGALDFVADVLGGLTSPLNLATGAAFGGAKALGLPILNRVGQALSVPTAVEGGENILEGIQERDYRKAILGGLELGGSVLGMKSGLPKKAPKVDLPVEEIISPKPNLKINKDFAGTWSPENNPKVIIDEAGTQIAGPLDKRFKSEVPEVKSNPLTLRDKVVDVANLPRALKSSFDLSAPFRQGLGLIGTKSWWTSWDDMLKAGKSEQAFQNIVKEIESRPNFIPEVINGKVGKSFAERSGLYLGKIDDISQREEAFMSKYAEKVPGVRASNRAYTAFLNKLRADNFDNLIAEAEKAGLDPKNNVNISNQIAAFVNNASGRGSLGSLEKAAKELNATFFSPRLITSRLKMMNPATYVQADPFVRKQYLKSLLGIAGAWTSMAGLAKMAGAEVSLNPTNPDFGKVKIGESRFDPAGGFQQYLVLASKLANQGKTSSTTGKFTEYGSSPVAGTFGEDIVNFVRNKLAPVPKFFTDPFFAKGYNPFHPADEAVRLFTPMILEDLSEIMQTDPSKLPELIPASVGIGRQDYSTGDTRLLGDWTKQFDTQIPRKK